MQHQSYETTEKEKKIEAVRQIIRQSALKADWLPIPEKFYSGDVIGFDLGDISFRANVEFDKFGLKLNLTSPVVNTASVDVYHRRQTFFSRNPPGASLFEDGVDEGPATKKCIFEAKKLLIHVYVDWYFLYCRRESIRRRLAELPEFTKEFLEKEKARTAVVKEKIKELSAKSGENKKRFKAGEITQEEYMKNKQPLHEEIVSLLRTSAIRDPYCAQFREELYFCWHVGDPKKFLESI